MKALKHTYLITGEKLRDDAVGCRILVDPEKFEYISNTDGYSFWPKAEVDPDIEHKEIGNKHC